LLVETLEERTVLSSYSLDFHTLPSAQGWTYDSGNRPESSIFSVDGTKLTMNSMGTGLNPVQAYHLYDLLGVVDPSSPFTISIRARVDQTEGYDANFGFAAFTGTKGALVGIGRHEIVATGVGTGGTVLSTSIDGTQFHDYRMQVDPVRGFDFFVDNAFIGSEPLASYNVSNRLDFGDRTIDGNSQVEITSFSFTQDLPDLVVTPPTWTAGQGVTFDYTISGTNLAQATKVGLYWSTDDKFDLGGPNPDSPAYGPIDTKTAQGTYQVPVNHSALTTPPQGTKYLLAVIDPSNAVAESDEPGGIMGSNNVKPLRVGLNSTTVSVAATPAVFAQPETLTATVRVTPPGAGTPTGTVTFMDGTTVLATSRLSTSKGVTTATFTTPVLSVGTHRIIASYSGDASDQGSTSAPLIVIPVWVRAFSVGAWSTAWAAGGDLVLGQGGNLTVLDPAAGSVRTFGVGAWSSAWLLGNYLALASGTSVSVVNLANATLTKFNVGAWSQASAANGDLVLVAGGNLEVLDPSAGKLRTFGLNTFSASWTTGDYTALASGSKLTVVNLATGSQTTLNVGSWSTGRLVGTYLALASGTSVSIINLANATLAKFNVGAWTQASAVGGDIVFVVGGNLVVVNPGAGTMRTFAVGTFTEEWTVGNYVALASGTKITEVNLSTGAKTTFNIGSWSQASLTGNELVLVGGNGLSVLDLAAATLRTFAVGTWSTEWTVGNYVALAAGGKVTVVNLATGAQSVADVGTWNTAWKFSNYLAFASGGKVTVLNLA
jgi:hypothetical protein